MRSWHTHRDKPEDWIYHLPSVRTARRAAFLAAGIERITDIPDEADLGAIPARIRQVLRSGQPYVSADLEAALVDSARRPSTSTSRR